MEVFVTRIFLNRLLGESLNHGAINALVVEKPIKDFLSLQNWNQPSQFSKERVVSQ